MNFRFRQNRLIILFVYVYFVSSLRYESRYKIGLVHNVQFSIRYAKHKETTAVISIMLPSEYTRNVDLYLNVTVPSFGSCSAQIKATQRKSNQYDVSHLCLSVFLLQLANLKYLS